MTGHELPNSTGPAKKGRADPSDPDANEPAPEYRAPGIRWLLIAAAATVVYYMSQEATRAYDSLVVWAQHPDMSTVLEVLQTLPSALTLGAIRGIVVAPAAVLVLWLGPAAAGVIANVGIRAAAATGRFASAFVRTFRTPPDKPENR